MGRFGRLSCLPVAGLVGLSSIWYAAPVAFSSSSAAVPAAECRFALRAQPPTAVIEGPEAITSRVRFVAQPDSPVAITRVDFGGANLMVAGEWFVFDKGYAVELINLTDEPLSNIQVRVHIRSRHGGAGGGPVLKGPLAPGQSASLRMSGGRAQGTAPMADVRVLVGVESVDFADCVYKPSQVLPVSGKPLP